MQLYQNFQRQLKYVRVVRG